MKKLLVLFVALGLIFVGCSPDPDAEYSVIYHGDGSASGFPPTDSKKYKYGEEAVVLGKHTLEKPGYTFKNWNTKSDGTGHSYEPGSKITINGAVFLYATWEALP
jgi:hypothetical protein